jgi:hypothetical protein
VALDPSLVPTTLRLPVPVDLEGVRADLASVPAELWTPHFNLREYEGDWSGVALRSVGGDPRRLYPDLAHRRPYEDTPLLERAPAVRALLEAIGSTYAAVRFLRLGPGARIREHRDYDLGFAFGEVRLHVPVIESEGAELVLDGQRVPMRVGELWYLDFGLPHRAANTGPGERVHLVIDAQLGDALERWMAQALPRPAGSPPRSAS